MLKSQLRGGVAAALGLLVSLVALPAFSEAEASVDASSPAGRGSELASAAAAPASPESSPLAADGLWDDEGFDEAVEPADLDPLEPGNRAIFRFNEFVDDAFWSPVITGYRFVAPEPVRLSVRRFFSNLNSPAVLVNDLLQGHPVDAGRTLGRFVLNSTLGVFGLFDAARQAGEGWEGHRADFGQTLALAGLASGPYVMVPLFGPNTLRDSVGGLVDLAMQPLTYVSLPLQLTFTIGSTYGLAVREENGPALEALRESSIDHYAAMRSAYFQHRRSEIWSGAPPAGAH